MPAKSDKPKPWAVCFLPLLDDRDEHRYGNFGGVKTFCASRFDDLDAWCNRYNKAGKVVIDLVRRQVAETEGWFWQNPELQERVIEGCFDDHTGMRVHLRIRKVPT